MKHLPLQRRLDLIDVDVIDAQLHLPPDRDANWLLEEMRRAGVRAALLVNQSIYGPDNSRQFAAAQEHPDRFAVVAGIDPSRPDLEEEVASLSRRQGVVAIRAVIQSRASLDTTRFPPETLERWAAQMRIWESGGYVRLFAAMQEHQLPICMYLPGRLDELGPYCRAFPDLQFVIDHLNLSYRQHPSEPRRRRVDLSSVLALAEFPNVAVKASGLPAQSMQSFPFADVLPHLRLVISTFGLERVMWGSDWTVLADRCTYRECVDYVLDSSELSTSDKGALMGQSLSRLFGWGGMEASE